MMPTQIAELERPIRAVLPAKTDRGITEDLLQPQLPLAAAKGIVIAVLISAPFWALFAFAVYLLI